MSRTPELSTSFYECQCPHLHRGLPFRTEFEQTMLQDSAEKFPLHHYPHVVYVSQGPGGFLGDIKIITELMKKNYTKIDLVFIEPLYETNADILYACLAIKTWCKEQSNSRQQLMPYFYTTIAEYTQACKVNENHKGHIFITVDPDDKKTIPNFSSLSFRKRFSEIFKTIMRPTCSFYYLYFQSDNGCEYRHMIIGEHTITNQKSLLKLRHSYGEQTLYEHVHTHVFLNSTPVYTFDLTKQMVQIGNKISVNADLASLF